MHHHISSSVSNVHSKSKPCLQRGRVRSSLLRLKAKAERSLIVRLCFLTHFLKILAYNSAAVCIHNSSNRVELMVEPLIFGNGKECSCCASLSIVSAEDKRWNAC